MIPEQLPVLVLDTGLKFSNPAIIAVFKACCRGICFYKHSVFFLVNNAAYVRITGGQICYRSYCRQHVYFLGILLLSL